MKKITYIFSSGRISKFSSEYYANDFFYGARFLKTKGYDLNIIEFQCNSKILKKIEHLLSKYLSLPLYIFSLLNRNNFKILKNSDHVILVSESTGFAAMPLIMLLKKKYKFRTHLFVMGLFSKKINYNIFLRVHNYLIKILIKNIEKVYFLGREEFLKAKGQLGDSSKLIFLPFHIDFNFWDNKKLNLEQNNKILFVGNDSNRDYELLKKIAINMQDYNFIFVSSNEEIKEINLENVKLINGNWSSSYITDYDMLNIYLESRITILPLKNSYQPSGQSVTLQSMTVGIPVMITSTKGFWDRENFLDHNNILFVNSQNYEIWVKQIRLMFNDLIKLKQISHNGKKTVKNLYSIDKFNEYLIETIEN